MKTYVMAGLVNTTAIVQDISRFAALLLTGLSVPAVAASGSVTGGCTSIDALDTAVGVPTSCTGERKASLSYGFSVKNNTDKVQTYKYSYGESITSSIAGLFRVYADISGSVTNSNSCTAASLSPVFGDQDGDGIPEIQVLRLSSDGGITFTNAGVDVGVMYETASRAGGHLYGVYSGTIESSTDKPWNYWQIETVFTLSPGGNVAALTGYAEIVAIPEPSTYVLYGSIGVFFGTYFLRRKRATYP